MKTFAAADLGASSGRVIIGRVDRETLDVTEAHRFPNRPVAAGGRLQWDILAVYAGVLDGLRAAGRSGPIDGIGVDSWGVDYGLLDADGALLGNPVHYRDSRTDVERVTSMVGAERLYGITGIQFQPINTINQLAASVGSAQLGAAQRLLLIPDLIGYWLTGEQIAERTNASTTQLLDARTREWSFELASAIGIDPALLVSLREPGDMIGPIAAEAAGGSGIAAGTPVIAVGSHDTASAVVAVPAETERFAYVSCGTWSLVGVELAAPVLTAASREANFSNEGGVDRTTRYLQNVMGLWLLQESIATWERSGERVDLAELLRAAAVEPALRTIVDPNHSSFLAPGDMPARVAAVCRAAGEPVPASRAGLVRCLLDSLALAFDRSIRLAQELSGRAVDVVHIVGGGARNELLCQLTADATGLPVVAGPVEAAALGNLLVQARAAGAVSGGMADLRALVRRTQPLRRYEPSGSRWPWVEARARLGR